MNTVMMKNIFSLVAIAVIGTSTCFAKATPKPIHNHNSRMEHKAVLPPATTTVTTTTETIRPNGTKVITTTTTKTVNVAPSKPAKSKMTSCHKHHRGTCKDCKKQVKPLPRK